MNLTKGQTLLYIYNKLEKEKVITKAAMMDYASITDITFKRYFAEIRLYLKEYEPQHEIKYVRKKDIYILAKVAK